MNISNNIRFQTTEEKIEKALFSLLHVRKPTEIYVKEICYEAGINRSSFYAHYSDINDLMVKLENKLSKEVYKIFNSSNVFSNEDFIKLFTFLKDKQDFYKAYLQNNQANFIAQKDFTYMSQQKIKFLTLQNSYSTNEAYYHMAFFGGGLNAIAKMWLTSGCKETPEQMADIIYKEYTINTKFINKTTDYPI